MMARKLIAASMLALGLSVPTMVLASPASETDARHQKRAEMMQKMMSPEAVGKRLDKFKAELKLTSAQENAWQRYRGFFIEKVKGFQDNRSTKPDWKSMTRPERLEYQLEKSRQRLASMEQHLDETKRFYDVLTPEQKKVFDMHGLSKKKHGDKKMHDSKSKECRG